LIEKDALIGKRHKTWLCAIGSTTLPKASNKCTVELQAQHKRGPDCDFIQLYSTQSEPHLSLASSTTAQTGVTVLAYLIKLFC